MKIGSACALMKNILQISTDKYIWGVEINKEYAVLDNKESKLFW